MDVVEIMSPILGIQCTLLAVFIVVALPHTVWTITVFPLVIIGTVFTFGWAGYRILASPS